MRNGTTLAMKEKLPTISDVARHAGVSSMTVSRVINGENNVREATRTSVLKSIETLNYIPNVSARALAGNRLFKFALLYANPSAFYLSELLVAALEAISLRGHQLLVHKVSDIDSDHSVEDQLSTLIGRFEGVIVPPPMSDFASVREFLVKRDLPAVFLSGKEGYGRSRRVCIDDYSAAREITEHLIALGHERIGLIKGHPNQFSSEERLRGYKEGLRDAGIKFDKTLVAQGYFTYDSGLKAAKALLSRSAKPTAIFASNDDMAAATLAVAISSGLRVPTDLSVAGFDDSPVASTVFPRLTTVKQPLSEMAAAAVDSLIQLASGKQGRHIEQTSPTISDYKIVKGGSTAPLAREH